jgi:hypothetical protein
MAVLVTAIHAVRRFERPKLATEARNLCICGLWQRVTPIRTRICGATVWMAGTSPAMTGEVRKRNRRWLNNDYRHKRQ